MATVISKEDLKDIVKTGVSTATATPLPTGTLGQVTSFLNQLDLLLKNPLVQNLIMRFAGRFGLNPIPQNNPISSPTIATPTAENVYQTILGSINTILKLKGDMPLSQLKTELITNKENVIKLISKSFTEKKPEVKVSDKPKS